MHATSRFWNLRGLTNAALLGGLSRLVGSGRQLLAEVVAHLAEVEERRLHLDSGYGSMFAYCTSRLGLSEDEACRRIEAARIARRHPDIFPLLASGQLSLSVIAMLKPYLVDTRSKELLELVSGKSATQARELLAARFPRPDVASKIRKLPGAPLARHETDEYKGAPALPVGLFGVCQARAVPASTPPAAAPAEPASSSSPRLPNPPLPGATPRSPCLPTTSSSPGLPGVSPVRPARAPRVIEPLSAARFRIQLTADTALKDKLELARDLMRHTVPDGDFAPILSRALDLLIEQLMKRRFGARGKNPAAPHPNDVPKDAPPNEPVIVARAPATQSSSAAPNANLQVRHPAPVPSPGTKPEAPSATAPRKTISRSTRRAVAERDGLRCTWQSPDGVRCESRAWLENDHADPRGRGGSSEPQNIRLLCRSHNQRAAELHYGRSHVAAAITRARERRSPPSPAPPPSP